jgi:2-polyprenyl-6-methoxyphenol hydroxylase-like FAD-dependent oxidoreductase
MGRNILIAGAGVAGLTLAYWLVRAGITPIVVETSAELRTGGYMVDFWGTSRVSSLRPEIHGTLSVACAFRY